MPETEEDIRRYIQDFVNVYSAMYKNAKQNSLNRRLTRGTSRDRIPKSGDEICQLLSTSKSEDVAKTFCEYGNAAIINIVGSSDVPYLDVSEYRDENRADEQEIVLAPFCRVARAERTSEWNGYSYHNITLRKPSFPAISEEELDTLMTEIVSGFVQNVEDMKEAMYLSDMVEVWTERASRVQGDREDAAYVAGEKQKALDGYFEKNDKVKEFRTKLQTLLKGLCGQKERQIDEADRVIEEDKKRREEQRKIAEQERQARLEEEKRLAEEAKKETARVEKITEVNSKLESSPQQQSELENTILSNYRNLLESEQRYIKTAQFLGISYTKTSASTSIQEQAENIQMNLKRIQEELKDKRISQDASFEEVSEAAKEILTLTDGVSYGVELVKDLKSIVDLHSSQSEQELKKNLYFKVQRTIQDAKIQKYLNEKNAISSEKVGFWGRLTGREDLKNERLTNANLKIRLEQSRSPEVRQSYSVRDMLADMQVFAMTEYNGQFPPEMRQLYDSITQVYCNEGQVRFSDEQIKAIARRKIEESQRNLPVVQKSRRGFFGKTKAQIEDLRLENQGIEEQIRTNRARGTMPRYIQTENPETDAILQFENILKNVRSVTRERSQAGKDVDLEDTLELFGN